MHTFGRHQPPTAQPGDSLEEIAQAVEILENMTVKPGLRAQRLQREGRLPTAAETSSSVNNDPDGHDAFSAEGQISIREARRKQRLNAALRAMREAQ